MQVRRRVVLGLFVTLLACTGEPTDTATRAPLRSNDETSVISTRGPTRAQTEEVADIAPPEPPQVSVQRAPRAMTDIRVEILDADAQSGEDGRGRIVPASDPVYVDLVRPGGFPGRARDPELHAGQLRFSRYSHPAPDRLRFVVKDRALLTGAPLALQYEADPASHTPLQLGDRN